MPIVRPTLSLYGPAISAASESLQADLTNIAVGWSRSKRGLGGDYQGELVIFKDSGYNIEHLFYNGLMYDLRETTGGARTWRGFVGEMEMVIGGDKKMRTIFDHYNYVVEYYTDNDNEIQISGAAENATSIRRYGRREFINTITNQDQDAAEQHRDTFLKDHGGKPRPIKVGNDSRPDCLVVKVFGYIWTLNFRYENVGDGSSDSLSDWLSEIVTTDAEYLRVGSIASNTRSVIKSTSTPILAWDQVHKLNSIGISGAPSRYYVDHDRFFHYKLIDTVPRYFQQDGMIFGPGQASYETHAVETDFGSRLERMRIGVNPWALEPAVVRDQDYPSGGYFQDQWLALDVDDYMSEITVSDNGPNELPTVSPGNADYRESDLQLEVQRFEQMQEQLEAKG